MHFNFPQSGLGERGICGGVEGEDGEDGEDAVDGAVGDVDPGGSAVAEPFGELVGAPRGVGVCDGITIEGDGNPPVRDGPEPLGGADVGLLQAATRRIATATTLNRRPLTTPKRYGPAPIHFNGTRGFVSAS